MSDQTLTARQIMGHLPSAFQPAQAEGVNAVVQWLLSGEDGGEWYVTIANGTCQVAEGRATDPKVTVTMDAQDYVALTTGKLDAIKAFMTGKIKLSGDFALATRLTSFFRAP